MIRLALGLLCVFSVVGGIELLPADAGVFSLIQLGVVLMLGILLMVQGIEKLGRTA
jgi:hypothetical protein